MTLERPDDLQQALSLLAQRNWSVLSGGTDFYPSMQDNSQRSHVLDISGIDGLRSITKKKDCWEFGALSTWTDIINCSLPPAFDSLKLAAREVGSVQIQNRATLAGNLCNASPAADGVPPLLTLDARVRLSDKSGEREMALADFITGNRATQLRSDELLTSVLVPVSSANGNSSFLKLGSRKYLVISIAMSAVRLELNSDDTIADIAIAVGSCSEVAQRLTNLEDYLKGKKLNASILDTIGQQQLDRLTPISDVRASAHYRQQASAQLVRRTVEQAWGESL